MSDVGLYEGIYEQLRRYADELDRRLIDLRSSDENLHRTARKELAGLLRELQNRDSGSPKTRLVATVLRRESGRTAKGESEKLRILADVLESRQPTALEMSELEEIATFIDRECSSASARTRGKT